jgi:hypothetical protein
MIMYMKALVIGLVAILMFANAYAQLQTIEVSTSRTVSLVFPSAVSHIDLGNKTIDARLVGPGSKVVLVKALETNFRGTNLTVVTAGDKVYKFDIQYCNSPGKEDWIIAPKAPAPKSYAATIMDNRRVINGVRDEKSGVIASLQGIYAHKDHLFFHIKVSNNTALSYDFAAIRFHLVNRKGSRRAAHQELVIAPESFEGAYTQVPVYGTSTFVAVLPKFTITRSRRLEINIIENSGERNLNLKVSSRKFSHTNLLPNL